eukprot:COSAG02_NODE_9579_length_2172_cov_1.913169_3_plen_62_part_01
MTKIENDRLKRAAVRAGRLWDGDDGRSPTVFGRVLKHTSYSTILIVARGERIWGNKAHYDI